MFPIVILSNRTTGFFLINFQIILKEFSKLTKLRIILVIMNFYIINIILKTCFNSITIIFLPTLVFFSI